MGTGTGRVSQQGHSTGILPCGQSSCSGPSPESGLEANLSPERLQKESNWGRGQRQGGLSTKPVTSAPLSIGASESTLPHGL